MARQPRTTRADRPRRISVVAREETTIERWLRSLRLSGFGVIALGLLVIAVIVLAPSLRTLVEQQQEIAALELRVQQEQDRVDGLSAELDRWSDPAYIETEARSRLLFIYPGEASYIVTNPGGGEAVEEVELPISDQLQATDHDWLGGLLAATFEAGLTTEAAEDQSLVPIGGDS